MKSLIKTEAVQFKNFRLQVIDQTLLPGSFIYSDLVSLEDAYNAIKTLKVRGAPLIGIVAAYAIAVYANQLQEDSKSVFLAKLEDAAGYLDSSRPTAVNLRWALNRMRNIYHNPDVSVGEIIDRLKSEAENIHEEDRESCHQIGMNGLAVLKNPVRILTHCNTGSLATGGWGTALGIIYAAFAKKYDLHVYVDETRPLGQGARLTFWELLQNKIPCTLITDSTAGSLMHAGNIDIVLFGADRIARNGDVANKIGSYSLAVQAKYHQIPCYCAAPVSTFDISIASGTDIPIEKRDESEILQFYKYDRTLLRFGNIYNPAFDVTPAELLTGIITERGVLSQPLSKAITKLLT